MWSGMLLYDFLTKTNLKTLVYVYDMHSHAPLFYDLLDDWRYSDVRACKELEVKYWKRDRNGDELRVYVTPVKKEQEEAKRNE